MKKLLFIYSLFFSVLAVAQQTDKPYDFPVKPGTEQWAKLNTSKEMDEVCVIPYKELSKLSTKALLITCLNYPRIIDFFLFDDMQNGFEFIATRFNGLSELLRRSDLSQAVFASYFDLDIRNKTIKGHDAKLSDLQISFLELLLAQNKVLDGIDKEKKKDLLSKAATNLEKRMDIGESYYRQLTNALILSRVLTSENINPSEKDMYGNDIFEVFNSSAVVLDTTVIDKLLFKSKGIK